MEVWKEIPVGGRTVAELYALCARYRHSVDQIARRVIEEDVPTTLPVPRNYAFVQPCVGDLGCMKPPTTSELVELINSSRFGGRVLGEAALHLRLAIPRQQDTDGPMYIPCILRRPGGLPAFLVLNSGIYDYLPASIYGLFAAHDRKWALDTKLVLTASHAFNSATSEQ